MALCVARTFLPLLPGGDGADLRGKGMNKSGIKVNLFMFYHAKIFGTQSGQGKILQGIRLPLLIDKAIRFGAGCGLSCGKEVFLQIVIIL